MGNNPSSSRNANLALNTNDDNASLISTTSSRRSNFRLNHRRNSTGGMQQQRKQRRNRLISPRSSRQRKKKEASDKAPVARRRIVKATVAQAALVSPTKTDEDSHTTNTSAPSEVTPSNTTKVEQQHELEKVRQQRRDQLKQQVREGKKTPAAEVTANPFSRYLSIFSVEPEHPEHKRKPGTFTELDEIEHKRRRASYDEADDRSRSASWTTTFFLTAVAAAAIGAVWMVRSGKVRV